MDTPQLTAGSARQRAGAAAPAGRADAVLGPADDGGWWALGLRDPGHAAVLRGVPMSTAEHRALTLAALRRPWSAGATCCRGCATWTPPPTPTRWPRSCPPDSRFAAAVAHRRPVPRHGGRAGERALAVFDAALDRAARASPPRSTCPASERRRATGSTPAAWCRRRRRRATPACSSRCAGPTLDVGCGPGRLTGALNRPAGPRSASTSAPPPSGWPGPAAPPRCDATSSARCPAHGRWRHLLLADGNIGIGGDPYRLLRRCRRPAGRRRPAARRGRAARHAGLVRRRPSLHDARVASASPFRWACVRRRRSGRAGRREPRCACATPGRRRADGSPPCTPGDRASDRPAAARRRWSAPLPAPPAALRRGPLRPDGVPVPAALDPADQPARRSRSAWRSPSAS